MNPGEGSPDVVVVGAGIGGLACAAFLARAGLRAIENAGVLLPVLRMLGVEQQTALVPDPVGLGIEEEVVPLSSDADLAAWFAALARRFPMERSALEAIRADALEVSTRMAGVFEGENPLFVAEGVAVDPRQPEDVQADE
jgi:NADPH-dependent 2,4-dienoyl-CoA reductase/sulfur reductase-like enzyme